MFEMLYNIFIMPIELIVETIFFAMLRIFADQPGVCIIFVSLLVNLLILPLYKRADSMQEEQRTKVAGMDKWMSHIKKTFRGDERFMMLNTYYRIEGYKPIYAIKGSLSLLFQVPFFIAAYHFLSNLGVLNGAQFLFIKDLSAEDALISIGALSINLLPILMTLINILSGMIYTKGFLLKDKLQLYGMALLFLILLYKSPSGLVLYWTLNNLFSLCKNIFAKKIKHKVEVIAAVSAVFGVGLFAVLFFTHRLIIRRQYIIFGGVMLISLLPLIYIMIRKTKAAKVISEFICRIASNAAEKSSRLFWLSLVFMTLFLGYLIPVMTIYASPTEICYKGTGNPLSLAFTTLFIYAGLLIFWFGIFYLISKEKVRTIFSYCAVAMSGAAVVDYYFFFGKYGTLTRELAFNNVLTFNDASKLINLFVICVIVAIIVVLTRKVPKLVEGIITILILMTIGLSVFYSYKTDKLLREENYYESVENSKYKPLFNINRNGKNVIVIMLDRAISEYIPYEMAENPKLAAQFEDFIFYPNTISFGSCTNLASPALFGGYEYTPEEINKRSDVLLRDEQNAALSVMPLNFYDEGYEVTVCDPVYAGYKIIPDTTIYGDRDIKCVITNGAYTGEMLVNYDTSTQKRNFVMYSLFRTVPVCLENIIYDDGNYYGNGYRSNYYTCLESYSVLAGLDKLSNVTDSDESTFMMMVNDTTHEPNVLHTPDYRIDREADALPYSEERKDEYILDGKRLYMNEEYQVAHYHINMFSLMALGNWFDYLRQEGVYDNTRIILVSDHGKDLYQMDSRVLENGIDTELYNPLLLVKDFKASDLNANLEKLNDTELFVDNSFMTNADVPTLAFYNLLDNPVNPITDKPINSDEKSLHPQRITTSLSSGIDVENCGTTLPTEGYPWLEVSDDIFDMSNWKEVAQ